MVDFKQFEFFRSYGRTASDNLKIHFNGLIIIPASVGKDLPAHIDLGGV